MNRLQRLLTSYLPVGLCAGAVMWGVWLISCALGPGNLDLNGQVIGTDHTAFHTAAVMLSQGQTGALYDFPNLTDFAAEQELLTGKAGFLDPFRNPPFYALPYRSTAAFNYLTSYAIWAAAGLASLLGGLWLLRGARVDRALIWSMSFFPVFAAVSFGQNTLLSFGAFALTYRLLVREQRFLAGVAAGALLFKPQLLMGLGIWWALDVRRFWPALAGLGLAGSLLAGVSWLCVPAATQSWLEHLGPIAQYDAFDFYNLHNPRGFGALLFGNRQVGNWFGLAGMVLAAVWLVAFWRRQRSDTRLVFAASVLAMLWGSPHTMTYEWALAVIPAVIIWDSRPEMRSTWLPIFALSWLVLFVSTPLTKLQLNTIGHALQVSVPILAFVIWRTGQVLGLPNGSR